MSATTLTLSVKARQSRRASSSFRVDDHYVVSNPHREFVSSRFARVLPPRQFSESSPRKYNNDKLILHRKSRCGIAKVVFALADLSPSMLRIYYLFRFNRFYTYRPVHWNSSLTRGNKSLGDNCQSTKIPPRHAARPVRDVNKWIVRLRVFLAIVKRRHWMKTGILVWQKVLKLHWHKFNSSIIDRALRAHRGDRLIAIRLWQVAVNVFESPECAFAKFDDSKCYKIF